MGVLGKGFSPGCLLSWKLPVGCGFAGRRRTVFHRASGHFIVRCGSRAVIVMQFLYRSQPWKRPAKGTQRSRIGRSDIVARLRMLSDYFTLRKNTQDNFTPGEVAAFGKEGTGFIRIAKRYVRNSGRAPAWSLRSTGRNFRQTL